MNLSIGGSMLTVSEHPETLDQIQQTIQKWLGHSDEHEAPYTFSRGSGSSDLLCFISHNRSDLILKTAQQWVFFEMKETCLKLNLDKFLVSTAVEQATGAPTDFLVALEALSSAPGTSQLIAEDPLLAAKIRGLERKKQMLEASGGALSSEQVAKVLGISRQAVDKRRSSNQLLALTQGRRGYSYPSFQFEDGRTIRGLEEVLTQLKPLDPWMQMVFFTSPNERLGGKTPIESLQKGLVGEVTRAASGYGEQGAL